MKKICIVTNIPSPYRVDLFNYLIDNYKEYSFSILYSSKEEEDRGWYLDQSNLKNSVFIKSKSITLKKKMDNKYIHFNTKIFSYLDTYNPDIVIAAEYNPSAVISILWAKLRKKKYISWSDGTLNSEKNINFIQKILRRIICKNADAFIASSHKTKEAQIFYGANKNNIYISYLTIDVKKFLYRKEHYIGNRILFVGRLSYTKGLDILIKILSKINEEYIFTIVGDGPERPRLESMCKNLGIENNVKFLGSKGGEELKAIYRENDIFILPSRCDCFGLVLTEAMCSSMALISSKYADGAYDLIDNGINGYIVDIYNSEEFSKKIIQLLSNKKLVSQMGINSYKKVSKFRIEDVAIGIKTAIDNVI